jgi:anti-sigma factor RsiW
MSSCTEYYSAIQLYVDGELTKEESEGLFSHLENCADCRNVLKEAEASSSLIRASRPYLSAPESLRSAVLLKIKEAEGAENTTSGPTLVTHKPQRRTHFRLLAGIAAALALVTVGGLAFYGRMRTNDEPMVRAAMLAHEQLEQNAMPLDISSDSPQAVSAWFSSRVSFPFRMANSGMASDDRAKYKLVGGRLLTVGGDRVVLLSFSLQQEIISMLVGPGNMLTASGGTTVHSDGVALHSHDQGGVHIVNWNNRGLSYVMVANKPMSNSRQCGACHQESPSDKVTLYRSTAPDNKYYEPLMSSVKTLTAVLP